jgi:hypothetical protein
MATVSYAVLDPGTGQLALASCCAGEHPPRVQPLLGHPLGQQKLIRIRNAKITQISLDTSRPWCWH